MRRGVFSPRAGGKQCGDLFFRALNGVLGALFADAAFGGEGRGDQEPVKSRYIPCHGREQSITISLPPMSAAVYKCTRRFPKRKSKEGKEEKKELAVKAKAGKPAVRKSAGKPAVKAAAGKPAVKEKAAHPAVKEKAAHPAVKKTSPKPAVRRAAPKPAVKKQEKA